MSEFQEIVTIDGPSGVGKSTVSRLLAQRMGYTYLDTGAMYRAVAYLCREKKVDPADTEAVSRLLENIQIKLLPPARPGDDVRVILNGRDISGDIRTPEIGMMASRVSSLPVVREKLTHLQQRLGEQGRLVAEGRDTGTVVFPQAAWKFYLDAPPEERAGRRVRQLEKRGLPADYAAILSQIRKRDEDDQQRSLAPLTAADDAFHVDSGSLSADDVVKIMEDVILSCPIPESQ